MHFEIFASLSWVAWATVVGGWARVLLGYAYAWFSTLRTRRRGPRAAGTKKQKFIATSTPLALPAHRVSIHRARHGEARGDDMRFSRRSHLVMGPHGGQVDNGDEDATWRCEEAISTLHAAAVAAVAWKGSGKGAGRELPTDARAITQALAVVRSSAASRGTVGGAGVEALTGEWMALFSADATALASSSSSPSSPSLSVAGGQGGTGDHVGRFLPLRSTQTFVSDAGGGDRGHFFTRIQPGARGERPAGISAFVDGTFAFAKEGGGRVQELMFETLRVSIGERAGDDVAARLRAGDADGASWRAAVTFGIREGEGVRALIERFVRGGRKKPEGGLAGMGKFQKRKNQYTWHHIDEHICVASGTSGSVALWARVGKGTGQAKGRAAEVTVDEANASNRGGNSDYDTTATPAAAPSSLFDSNMAKASRGGGHDRSDMKVYCKTETFKRPFPEVKPHLEAHRSWVAHIRSSGRVVVSGYRVDREDRPGGGGLMLLLARTYDEALELVLQDPLVHNECVDWQLTRWIAETGDLEIL